MSCKHEVFMHGLCCNCGMDLSETNRPTSQDRSSNIGYAILHGNTALRVSQEKALDIGLEDQRRLLKSRKLALILDLDHTIVHSKILSNDEDADPDSLETPTIEESPPRFLKFQLKSNEGMIQNHITCIRKGTREFLKRISELFEIHIFTQGCRDYADKIASFLDKDSVLFGDRIRTRNESSFIGDKSFELRSLFPCGDQMVCIFDDRFDVWYEAENVILAHPFVHFENSGDINSEKSPDSQFSSIFQSLTTLKRVSQFIDEETYLDRVTDLMAKIHGEFYHQVDMNEELTSTKIKTDVRLVIKEMKERIMKNCVIMLSGCVPIQPKNIKACSEACHQSRIEKLLTQMGASIADESSSIRRSFSDITHLICAKSGTKKYFQALEHPNIMIIDPAWVFVCSYLWKKVDEDWFSLILSTASSNKPMGLGNSKRPFDLVDNSETPSSSTSHLSFNSSEFFAKKVLLSNQKVTPSLENLACFGDDETLLDVMSDNSDDENKDIEEEENENDRDSVTSSESKNETDQSDENETFQSDDTDVNDFANELEKYLK